VRRTAVAVGLTVLALAGPLVSTAAGQQRVDRPDEGELSQPQVTQRIITIPNQVPYVREGWEVPGIEMPLLPEALVVAVHEDDNSLRFQVGNELGAFRPAPAGGSAFFGVGRAIFGITAPPILPSRVLRPLGSGDTGDRFLGAPPAISDNTVIPKIGDTFDLRRHSYAFLSGVPALEPAAPAGSTKFPLASALTADENGDLPDNIPSPPTSPPTTTPPPFTPGTTPTTTAPTTTTVPPPTTTPGPTPTTAPPSGTTTTAPPPTTTTTTPPTTTTTAPTTTTTTAPPTTTTTAPPPTTTTTQPPPGGGNGNNPGTTFVLGRSRQDAAFCLSSAGTDGFNNGTCDKVFDPSRDGRIVPGVAQKMNVTLWNVDPDSDTDAVALKVFAPQNCTSGTSQTPAGSGNLCDGLRLRIDRYSSLTDRNNAQNGACLSGCSGNGDTLSSFRTAHGTFANGVVISSNFPVNAKTYLVVTALLPDTGFSASGRGNDNPYLARTADLRLTWQMVSA
jgi:hypothetical protein